MPEPVGDRALLKLMAWLSPTFPVGSFSYSHGLERAVYDGQVDSAQALGEWLRSLLHHGSAWNDAVLFAEAWRCASAGEAVGDVAELGIALAGSAERFLETDAQGAAFGAAMNNWGGALALPDPCNYSVAVGAQAGASSIPLESALGAFLQAFVANQLQAAIRLSIIGQSHAVALLAALETEIATTAARAARSSLDDIGSATLTAEIAAMRHETQYSRLFRT